MLNLFQLCIGILFLISRQQSKESSVDEAFAKLVAII